MIFLKLEISFKYVLTLNYRFIYLFLSFLFLQDICNPIKIHYKKFESCKKDGLKIYYIIWILGLKQDWNFFNPVSIRFEPFQSRIEISIQNGTFQSWFEIFNPGLKFQSGFNDFNPNPKFQSGLKNFNPKSSFSISRLKFNPRIETQSQDWKNFNPILISIRNTWTGPKLSYKKCLV